MQEDSRGMQQEVEGLKRHGCQSMREDATLSSPPSTVSQLCSCSDGLLCIHISAATLGLNVTKGKMAKVNTQCSQPALPHLSVNTMDRDLHHTENSLGR